MASSGAGITLWARRGWQRLAGYFWGDGGMKDGHVQGTRSRVGVGGVGSGGSGGQVTGPLVLSYMVAALGSSNGEAVGGF